MKNQWIYRWHNWIASKPTLPGIWRRKEGGHVARGRAVDPKTGKLREVVKSLPDADAPAAYAWLQAELKCIREGETPKAPSQTRFCDWSVSLLERKMARGEIRSAASVEKWKHTLADHLIPHFGAMHMDQIRRADIEAWKTLISQRLVTRSGPRPPATIPSAEVRKPQGTTSKRGYKRKPDATYAPTTANSWLSVLCVILTTYAQDHELERNPAAGVTPFDTRGHRTYTKEQPNALTVTELGAYLVELRNRYPQHYAMVFLGFVTGLRPSSLRPLRKQGPSADIDWNACTLEVRRSHTLGDAVMDLTKTAADQCLALPKVVIDVLRWHVVEQLTSKPMADSELLFPRDDGGLRTPSSLKRALATVARASGVGKRITARAMRRTFQDLARSVELRDVVTRSISGHATEAMQRRYSTVGETEQRAGIAKIVNLATAPEGRV